MEDNHSLFHQMQVGYGDWSVPLLYSVFCTYVFGGLTVSALHIQAHSSGIWLGGEVGPPALPDRPQELPVGFQVCKPYRGRTE